MKDDFNHDNGSEIVTAAVANRYEACMAVFEDKGQQSIASTMEMWNALLEIYARKLWVARFNTASEWLHHVDELGYTGMSRSNIYFKLNRMKMLMSAGVKQELAAAAVTAVPGAVGKIGTAHDMLQIAGDGDPNDYINELIYLPPGEAVQRVRTDKGNTVEMWFQQLTKGVRVGEIVGVIVRSDGTRGYTAYDFKATVTPQVPGNAELVDPVVSWATHKIVGSHSVAAVR